MCTLLYDYMTELKQMDGEQYLKIKKLFNLNK